MWHGGGPVDLRRLTDGSGWLISRCHARFAREGRRHGERSDDGRVVDYPQRAGITSRHIELTLDVGTYWDIPSLSCIYSGVVLDSLLSAPFVERWKIRPAVDRDEHSVTRPIKVLGSNGAIPGACPVQVVAAGGGEVPAPGIAP